MKKPFFSIIIPTFNRAHILHLPVESILAQSFTDWELIIVDDGSTDDTKAIVETYQDNRIRYVYQENQERSAARNHGIRLAKGDWICFQDSDDAYLPEHLAVLNKAITDYPNNMIIKSGIIIFDNGVEIARSGLKPKSVYDTFPYGNYTTACFHRSVVTTLQFDERFYMSEDLHFILRTGLKFGIRIIPFWTGIVHYNPKNKGLHSKDYMTNLQNMQNCLDDIISWNKTAILPYLYRNRCLTSIIMLHGHMKYNWRKIPTGILDNIRIFIKNPVSYLKLILRIVWVNVRQLFAQSHTRDLF
ncbi:MAG TPA: glycosyltransferase family 2 protein [Saprospiraceae bacterium]|jgi:glycosyltransferase involved in cell wall biosynthesis|nr:glycosyltransferase family 2 protein [Saprospiraceae bacterium]HRO07499.1 glycosyltransferase family 2 protein [Saprospiraceae bacterium]HRP40782.1 glycosyltransferase family 2 protein [Saprospiraceae bacterium]